MAHFVNAAFVQKISAAILFSTYSRLCAQMYVAEDVVILVVMNSQQFRPIPIADLFECAEVIILLF